MISEEVEVFLTRPLHAVLATNAPNATISQSVVWYVLDGDSLWISCRPNSAKARHVREDPQVSLLVLAPHGGAYVRIEGTAVLDEEVSPEQRLELVSRYRGADAGGWIEEHPLPSPNARLRIQPERVVTSGELT